MFEFGHGLHYTTFSLTLFPGSSPAPPPPAVFDTASLLAAAQSAINSSAPSPTSPLVPIRHLDQAPFVSLPVSVANTGNATTSDFVVLAFLRGDFGPAPVPRKSLVAFTRVHDLAPGKAETVALHVALGSVARADDKGDLVLWPGSYRVELDVDGKVGWNFTITGDSKVLDSWPAR